MTSHELPGWDKTDWRALPRDTRWQLYRDAYLNNDHLIDEVNASLVDLEKLLHCGEHCTEGGLSLDDIDLFSRLRSVTIIHGVELPGRLNTYMNHLSVLGDVPLYTSMAC